MPSGIYGNGLIVCPTKPDSGVCRQGAATALSSTLSAVSTPYRFDSLRITDYPRRSSESSQPLTRSESRSCDDLWLPGGVGGGWAVSEALEAFVTSLAGGYVSLG